MKKRIKHLLTLQKGAVTLLRCVCMVVLAGNFSSCSQADNNIKDIYLENAVLFPCENNTKSVSTSDSKYIKFSAINNSTLKVEKNFFMNCCTEDIYIEINSEGNNITISITDEDSGCNCICERIVSYSICNLQKNNIYELIFLRNNYMYYTCELIFNNQLSCEIQL